MKKNILIKGLTLLGFVLLLSLFILYRTDKLNPSTPINDQALAKNSLAADTIPQALKDLQLRPLPDSAQKPNMLFSSSKSIVVMKERPSYLDSILLSRKRDLLKKQWMMSSSKSVIIIPSAPALKLIDSIPTFERKYKTVKQ